jgi:hypothetical protein
MSWLKICGMVLAGLLLLGSLAHGLAGWPQLRDGLEQSGVAKGSPAMNDAAAGWVFGSVCMFVFGVIVVSTVLSMCKGATNLGPIVAIGFGLLAFGIGGCVWIHVGLHFVCFCAMGLLFLIWAWFARNWTCSPAMEETLT